MDSPRPPGSSPFPFPLPSFSPFPVPPSSVPANTNANPANPNLLGPSPNPFSIPSNPASTTPFPLGSFASSSPYNFASFTYGNVGGGTGTGFTPTFAQNLGNLNSNLTAGGSGANGMGTTGGLGLGLGITGMNAGGGMNPANGPTGEMDGISQMKAGLEALSAGVERAMVVLQEIKRMEDGLFAGTDAGRSEGMECGLGGLSRLELLHIEYTQLLSSLLSLSSTSLASSLPCPLSDALPNPPVPGSTETSAPAPTMEDLTAYAEKRANLEFNRRESVRIASKTVLDVLNKR